MRILTFLKCINMYEKLYRTLCGTDFINEKIKKRYSTDMVPAGYKFIALFSKYVCQKSYVCIKTFFCIRITRSLNFEIW